MPTLLQVFGCPYFSLDVALLQNQSWATSIDGSCLAFAQFFHDLLFLNVKCLDCYRFSAAPVLVSEGSLVQEFSPAIDAGRLAFAQFFHDLLFLNVKCLDCYRFSAAPEGD